MWQLQFEDLTAIPGKLVAVEVVPSLDAFVGLTKSELSS